MTLPGVAEARARMLAHVAPLAIERVESASAGGRVLREEIRAERDQPPCAASAMDGWAVRIADAAMFAGGLRIVGESAAGSGWDGTLAAGEAVRISTGAPLPAGADLVVVQEEAEREGDRVRLEPAPRSQRFVRPQGADFRVGDILLGVGARLDPWTLALAAAAGRTRLDVSARPHVVIVPTGDEIAAPGAAPGPWQIHDAAGAGVAAWFVAMGCTVWHLAPLRDDASAVTDALRDLACDLLVTIGGASVGDHDVVKPALAAIGLDMHVDGVAVRPGKPTWFGVLPAGGGARLVLGLPGNPVSAMVCAELFATSILAAMEAAAPDDRMRRARLGSALPANGPREHYMRAAIRTDDAGGLIADAAGDQDSSLVSVLAAAGALIRRPARAAPAAAGDIVELLMLDRTSRPG